MYEANLSFDEFKKYFEFLLKIECLQALDEDRDPVDIRKPKGGYTYKTTERGMELIKRIKNVNEILGPPRYSGGAGGRASSLRKLLYS